MEVIFYTTNSQPNMLHKILKNPLSVEVKLKDDFEILNPTLILQRPFVFLPNYCYIPHLNRYYYITNITTTNRQIQIIELKIDVLMSWKTNILDSYAYLTRQSEYNRYYNSNYDSEVRKQTDIIKSNVSIDTTQKSIIICTIGG